ncbi:MAG: DMT family transporter [Anaerolineae bacterium]|nr:DMT family transporter [Anaerolineae bacterium]
MTTSTKPNLHAYQGEVWALASAFSYAFSTLFLRVAVRDYELNYLMGTVLRATPTFLFALAMGMRAQTRAAGAVSPFSDWRLAALLVGYGVATFIVGNPIYFQALQIGGVAVATPVVGTMALWSALIAAVFLKQSLTLKMAGGILVTVAGIALLGFGQLGGQAISAEWWLAIPLALLTALSWSASGVLVAAAMARGVDRFRALAVATGSGILLLNLALLLGGDISVYASTPLRIHAAVLAGGLLNAMALVSVTTALSLTTVASATTINSLQIGLAPLLAWLVLGEGLNPLMVAGVTVIVIGVIVVQWR